jgi:hypothetical protein
MRPPSFFDEERGVRSDDPVRAAERDDLVDQLALLAVEADLVQEVGDLPPGPDQRQRRFSHRRRRERRDELVRPRRRLGLAHHGDLRFAASVVSAEDHELRPSEQVRKIAREDVVRRHAANRHRHVA